MRYRAIHGILASLALVVLFPIGSIFMRLVPGRAAVWVHAATQIIGFIIYVAAAGLGLHLVRTVRVPFTGESLVSVTPLLLASKKSAAGACNGS